MCGAHCEIPVSFSWLRLFPALQEMVGQQHITLTFFALLCAQHLELQQPHLVLELGKSS